jgi:dolichol-phosphate mannosyltransferase
MSIVLILGSAQLFVLGVLGEYLGRLYVESKRRPLFVIDRVAGGGFGASAAPADARDAGRDLMPASRTGA